MKSVHMPALIRMASMLETLKAQLKDDTPMGLDFCWNLATHCENITLNLIDDLYEKGGEKDE
jgi:hypothetical protein